MMKLRTRRAMALAGAAVALSIALTGCSAISSLLSGDDAPRDAETEEVTDEANIDVYSLRVGDCKLEDSAELVSETNVVPCNEPHDEEVFFEFEMEGDEYPGDDAVIAEGTTRCETAFVDYVGLSSEESVLSHFPFRPTEDGWNQGDHIIQCVLYQDQGEQLTESMKGKGI